MSLPRAFTDQRGIALPMALLMLVMLTMMMIAFAVLSQTEPIIASNQLHTERVVQPCRQILPQLASRS